MSSNYPAGPFSGTGLPLDEPPLWYHRRKFQHRYWVHGLLLLATLLTTTVAGAEAYYGFQQSLGASHPPVPLSLDYIFSREFLLPGLWYSVPILLILGAHEFGHYVLCRVHNVDATLPYFIPVPFLFITGTLGAVIRIREAFPSKRALFDIGIAGPIAGFVVLIPLLFWGVGLSELVPISHDEGTIYFGEPLLYQAAAWVHFGNIPEGYDVTIHPLAFAAWWGMLATALNLLPFGQLDGGHVVYSLVSRRGQAALVSAATLVGAALLTMRSLSWISMLVMMVVMALALGLHHPRVIDEDAPIGGGRRLVALFGLLMFLVCFTPVPIQTFFAQ